MMKGNHMMQQHKFTLFFIPVLIVLSMMLSAYVSAEKTYLETEKPTTVSPGVPSIGVDSVAREGTMLADLGFRPDKNGFPFQNYGPGYTNLTAEEMNRIYGDSVCANKTDGKCTLVPPAQQWMEQVNNAMNGGHCYGFAAASLRFFANQLNPADFSGASVSDFKIDGNDKLQREFAYYWSGQKFDSVLTSVIGGTPGDVLDKLIAALKNGASGEMYILAFFKRDGNGGHAVTPYAVEDRGNGSNAVLLYDNNYPNTVREMIIDRNANTWNYEASINPSVASEMYDGDAQTKSLFLFPVTPSTQQQTCTMCSATSTASPSGLLLGSSSGAENEIWLDGPADLIIVDQAGHKLGRVDGKIINEIPGAHYEVNFADTYDTEIEPTYYLPVSVNFKITLDGTNLKEKAETNLVVIGPGYDLGVEAINLDPGQKDEMVVIPKDNSVSYTTISSESPTFIIGLQREGADYEFEIKGAEMQGGGTLKMYADTKKGDLVVNAEGIKQDVKISVILTRIDDKTEETFENDSVTLKAGYLLVVNYAEWKGNNTPINMNIVDSHGKVVETFSSNDEK
jgi:hypothetical protein